MARLAAKDQTVKTAVHTAAEEVVAPKKRNTLKSRTFNASTGFINGTHARVTCSHLVASFEHGVVPATAGVPAGQPASQPPPAMQAVKAQLSPQ